MQFEIKFIDNQGRLRGGDVKASCFTNMMSEVEKEANEQGYGIKIIVSVITEGEV